MLFFSASAEAIDEYRNCSSMDEGDFTVGAKCWMNAYSVRPTQMVLGMDEVFAKIKKIERKNKKKLKSWLVDHTVPVVKGPRNELFATDHHHTMSAVIFAHIGGVVHSMEEPMVGCFVLSLSSSFCLCGSLSLLSAFTFSPTAIPLFPSLSLFLAHPFQSTPSHENHSLIPNYILLNRSSSTSSGTSRPAQPRTILHSGKTC